MKKLANLAVVTILLMVQSIVAQETGWEMVYSENSELANVKGFSFVPGSNGLWETGYAAIFDGRILKTTDGGATWSELTAVIPEYIWGVSFGDEDTGYVAGQAGSIYKTEDGGVSWTQVYFNSGDAFNKVAFKNVNNGVATGYPNSLYTSDGGATWGTVVGNDNNYWSLDYAGGNTYYGVEAFTGEIGRSVNNGESWSEAENTTWDLTICVNFFDENIGLVGGNAGRVLVTTDGGSNWQEHTISNVEIICAGWFDSDTVWAGGEGVFKSTDQGNTWIQDTTIFGTGLYSREMFVTGMNVVVVSASSIGTGDLQIWRKVGPPPVQANFEASPTTVCTGSTVDFTDSSIGVIDSWTWTFEGGTPATSTDQNPTVTYNTPGEYDVKLVVTVGAIADSLTKTNYINAVLLPDQPNSPSGETDVCTGTEVDYSTDEVLYAEDYEWEVSPTDAGTLSVDMNTATLDVSDTWSGDFTIRVRASNVCGNGDWSDDLSGTIYPTPEDFILQGGGGYCQGGDGVEITLSGSEVNVDYELFLDGETTGIVVAGTGTELSFGMLTDEGFYEALAYTATCLSYMQEQVQVEILNQPLEPETPTGPETVCTEPTSDYVSTGTEDADSYVWTLSPDFAGTIDENGLEATVTWDSEFSGIAQLTIAGVNDCGEGNPSEALEVSVGAANPVITGEEMVCDFSTEFYEVENHEGSNYLWTISSGVITEGQGTHMITVNWSGEGNGTISVDEETVDGCTGTSEEFIVTIDDCTGIGENGEDFQFTVSPNPANDFVKIKADSPLITVSILNLNAELIEEVICRENEVLLKTDKLAPGLYFIKIETDQGVKVKKIILN